MKKFALTSKAKTDLQTIAIFTEERWGKAQRNSYLKQFDDAFHQLAKTPVIGKTCDEIRDGYRKLPQGSHLIFYRQCDDGVIEIVRILHKSMDVDSKF